MNFLMRASHAASAAAAAADQASPRNPTPTPTPPSPAPAPTPVDSSKEATTLAGLITDENLSSLYANENPTTAATHNGATYSKDHTPIPNRHVDVAQDEGWITIPHRELPDHWNDVKDIHSIKSLDRSFVFPGEQVHILACLSASKQETEIITSSKLAALMGKNATGQNGKHQNGSATNEDTSLLSVSAEMEANRHVGPKDGIVPSHKNDTPTKSVGESLVRMEDNNWETQTLLQRFKESHFFVRIAESNELLWSKRGTTDASGENTAAYDTYTTENDQSTSSLSSINAFIDKGRFDARVSGGVARNSVKCYSLANGDIVVLLQVNVGVDFLKDPTLEILQFEKYKAGGLSSVNGPISTQPHHGHINKRSIAEGDPCGELLKWLLPLDNNSINSPTRPLSPPLASASHKASFSGASGSQLFSFGHFRSYSMSSISSVPPNTPAASSSQAASSTSSKPSFELEDWDRFASQKFVKSQKTGSEGLLSFRGVPLEPERFSVRCGLEGIHIPGRRWRKHLEIVQPIDIHTFAADCNTDDLLCVQIKNVSPAHIPDITVYIDAVTIIFEETSRGGSPSSIPVTCIESGTDYGLPNLTLRRGEEHSFILKPATSMLKFPTSNNRIAQSPHSKSGKLQESMQLSSKPEDKKILSTPDQYAVLVSCRCNYTESRLFFKKATNWKPRISRDLMISVASEISQQNVEHDGRVSQLPVQVLTLQASNLTLEDLTLTVLAPTSITSPRSVLTLNSSPSSPASPFVGFSTTQKLTSLPLLVENQKEDDNSGSKSVSSDDQKVPISDAIPTTALACNHLWLQSRVPLGCVPSQSTATVKLELLPLTDGIITLDTLQISVKEKGVTYIPEHSLKINATTSIATGIV